MTLNGVMALTVRYYTECVTFYLKLTVNVKLVEAKPILHATTMY